MFGRVRRRFSMVGLALAMVAAACGGGDAGTGATTTTGLPTTTTEVPGTTTTADSSTDSSTTTMPGTSTTVTTTTTLPGSLPGEPFDIVPGAGETVGVIGVAHDDVLNVRSGPGTGYPVIATLGATAEAIATGVGRLLTGSIWYEIETGATVGWVNSAFVAIPGAVDDLTATIVADLGEYPAAETMLDLGQIVADTLASEEPPSRVRMSVAPTVGDLGEVTYDVVGLGDDSLFGFRLHVFGSPSAGGEGFVLKSVEGQVFCGRAVTGDGTCV